MGTTSNIGNLNVTLSADASQLVQEMNRAMDNVDQAVARFDKSVSSFGTKAEGMALKVIAGARAFSAIHKEIMHVIENVDRIPGMPATVIQSITQAKEEMSAFRAEIDVVIGKSLAFGADFFRAVGAGTAMALGSSDKDVENGLAEHRTGRQISDDQAEAADLKYHDKVVEANHKLKEAIAAVNLAEDDHIGKVAMLTAEAERLETHSKSQSITTLASIRDEIEAQQKLLEVARIRRTTENEIKNATDKLRETENALYGASLPAAERLNGLMAREWALKVDLYTLENTTGEMTQAQLEHILELKRQLAKVEEAEVPLVKAEEAHWEKIGNSITTAVGNGIEQGQRLKDVWHSLLKSIEHDMLQTFEKNLGDKLGSWGKDVSKGGGFWGSVFSMFTGHAGGGNVDGPSIVGENGPELFVPSGAGSIVNNDSLRASSGGSKGGDVYHIDARGADRSAIAHLEATIKSLNGSIESRSIAANIAFMKRTTPNYQAAT